jgi:hypothetical protein
MIASADCSRVAGVRFEDVPGATGTLAADLVVDTSGRVSLTQGLLEAIGSPRAPTVEIGMDQAYSTLIFEKPKDAPSDWLAVIHAPAPPESSRHGGIFPMEGGRWSVSLAEDHKAPSRRHRRLQGIRRIVPYVDDPPRDSRREANRRGRSVQNAVQRVLHLRPQLEYPCWSSGVWHFSEEGIGEDDELSHDGDDGDLWGLAGGGESLEDAPEIGI